MKRYWPLIVFGAVHAFMLLFLFKSGIYHNSSMELDLSLFFKYSSKIVNGFLPYRDFTGEYPPLAFVFFTIPRLVTSTLSAYHYAFIVELLIFDALGLFLLHKLSQQLRINSILMMAIYTMSLLAIGPIIIYRYDLIPAIIVLAFLYAFSKKRYKLCWAILAVGTMTKLYPIVIATILLIYQLLNRRYREALWGTGTFVITAVVLTVPGMLLNPGNLLNSFTMQAQRGLHADSMYSSLLLLGQNLGLTKVHIQAVGSTPISVDVVSSAANILAKIALALMLLALASLYWLFSRHSRNAIEAVLLDDRQEIANIINYSFLAVLIFMITNKVFSPQFIIWLCPIAPLLTRRWRPVPWIILILVSVLTYYLFPLNYSSFVQGNSKMVYILLARNILLIVLACWLIEWKKPIAEYQSQPNFRFMFKPYLVTAILVVITGSILCTQCVLNKNNVQVGTFNEMPVGVSAQDYANRAYTYQQKGKYDKAIADYSKAIEFNPKYTAAYNNRGYAYEQKSEYDEALADYSKAIELDPEYTAAYNNRGYLYILIHEYDKAISDASMAIQIDPTYHYAYDTRAEGYWNMGEYDKAITDSNKAIVLYSNEAYYYRNRGIAYKLEGEYDKAIVDLQKCIELSKDQSLTKEAQRILEEIKAKIQNNSF